MIIKGVSERAVMHAYADTGRSEVLLMAFDRDRSLPKR
jgi:hypothetical protein